MKTLPIAVQGKREKKKSFGGGGDFGNLEETAVGNPHDIQSGTPHLFYSDALQETYGKNPGKARVSSIGSIRGFVHYYFFLCYSIRTFDSLNEK